MINVLALFCLVCSVTGRALKRKMATRRSGLSLLVAHLSTKPTADRDWALSFGQHALYLMVGADAGTIVSPTECGRHPKRVRSFAHRASVCLAPCVCVSHLVGEGDGVLVSAADFFLGNFRMNPSVLSVPHV